MSNLITPSIITKIVKSLNYRKSEITEKFLSYKLTDFKKQYSYSNSISWDTDNISTSIGYFEIIYGIKFIHKEGCEFYDDDSFDTEVEEDCSDASCDCEYTKKLVVGIIYSKYIYITKKLSIEDDYPTILQQLMENKSLVICKGCENNLCEDDFKYCYDCYVNGLDSEDNCAICQDNCYGLWVKTSCNHKYHKKCFDKLVKTRNLLVDSDKCARSCPMCRKKLNYGDYDTIRDCE